MRAQQFGLSPNAVTHLTTFLSTANYHVKTAHGKSTHSYTHTNQRPLHGPGQGSCAAPAIWMLLSTLLLEVLKHTPIQVSHHNPALMLTSSCQVNFYIDNAMLWANNVTSTTTAQ